MNYMLGRIMADKKEIYRTSSLKTKVLYDLSILDSQVKSHDYSGAVQLLNELIAVWPPKQKAVFSPKKYLKAIPGTDFTVKYVHLLSFISRKTFPLQTVSRLYVSLPVLQYMKKVFSELASAQQILVHSHGHREKDMQEIQRMISLSAYELEVVLQLPGNMKGIKESVRSFLRLNRDPQYGVSLGRDGQSIHFAYGVDEFLARNLQAVFDRRPDQQEYLELFLKTFIGKDPREQSVKLDPRNVLTGMQVFREQIIKIFSQHLVPYKIIELMERHTLSLGMHDSNGGGYYYSASDVLDHNGGILNSFGDKDLFTYYMQAMFEKYLNDLEIAEAAKQNLPIVEIGGEGKQILSRIVAEAANRVGVFPLKARSKKT